LWVGWHLSICWLLFQWVITIKIQLSLVQSGHHCLIKSNFFSPWFTSNWKIAYLTLNNTHSLTLKPLGQSKLKLTVFKILSDDTAITTQIIWSSPQTVWLLRNIYFINGNGSFPFYVNFFLSSFTNKTFTGLDYMNNIETGNAYPSQAPGFKEFPFKM